VPAFDAAPKTIGDRRRLKDYQTFYFETVAEYVETVALWMRGAGIDCDFVHNAGGPLNPFLLETVRRMREPFILGGDHYYCLDPDWPQNNPTPQWTIRSFWSLEMLRAMGCPPTVYEMPSGSLSDWPPMTPEDVRCACYVHTALGMKGHNYYIFTGGPNPDIIGGFPDVYDYQAPIAADGTLRPTYHALAEFGRFLNDNSWLAETDRVADVLVGLDWNQTRSKTFFATHFDDHYANTSAWTLVQKGILPSLMCASYSPNLHDLGSDSLLEHTGLPLVVAASACMSPEIQRRLIQFVERGGKLVLAPVIPVFDEDFRPCTLLRDALGGRSCRERLGQRQSLGE
jgi:beta-galactosidase